MIDILDYQKALYRKNNFNQPCFWEISVYDLVTQRLIIRHGIIGKKTIIDIVKTHRSVYDEIDTRIKAKRKTGYKYLSELKDNCNLPVKEQLYRQLCAILTTNATK
jgi:predicted DNA-binding WGR domain protein